MTLDDIKPSEDVVMTDALRRVFAAAGCKPTVCHACSRKIEVGDSFKLVPHLRKPAKASIAHLIPHTKRELYDWAIDEMCCANCGTPELEARDRAQELDWSKTRIGGYSRPSKAAAKEKNDE